MFHVAYLLERLRLVNTRSNHKEHALDPDALQGFDIAEQPTAGHFPAHLIQAETDRIEVVFDQITPRENRYALSRILRTVCEHLPGRSGQVPIDQSISMCGLTTILIERVKFAEP